MSTHKISLAEEFSRFPFGRSRAEGDDSAERFVDEFVVPALQKNDEVVVELGGVLDFRVSFFDEVYERAKSFSTAAGEDESTVIDRIKFVTTDRVSERMFALTKNIVETKLQRLGS